MNNLEFTLIVALGSLVGGLLGSLTGLGGGVVIVPLLTLGFGVDIRYAVGASLVSIIATSSGAAAAYVREGFTNIRIGMFLEVATTLGALAGAVIAGLVSPGVVTVIFGVVLGWSAIASRNPPKDLSAEAVPDRWALRFNLKGDYPSEGRLKKYEATNVPAGFSLMLLAGVLSGLLGIGSGAMKVLAMDRLMRLPFKVSTTTSNFMIGVTAATSAGVYLSRGYVDPALAMPVMLGVLAGALIGSRLLVRMRSKALRTVFSVVLLVMAAQMIFKGLGGRF
jgi:uncharacterized protein